MIIRAADTTLGLAGIAIALAAIAVPPIAIAATDADKMAGDVVQFVVPLAALSVAWSRDDVEGENQWIRNTGGSVLATEVAKLVFNQTSLGRRPNGGRGSFPSGHTAMAASGASFLGERYGWEYAIPAWLATGFVGYSRVDEHAHHWWDVAAGAALSVGISKLFVTPQATHLAPIVEPHLIGLTLERSW